LLQDEITAGSVAAEALLLRAAAMKTIRVVEGSEDARLFENFIDASGCDIVIAYGKDNALEALSILEESGFAGVICIVDADFWHVHGFPSLSPNVVWTDDHDLDVMLVRSPACEKVVRELSSKEKMEKLVRTGRTIREVILEAAAPISFALMFSLQNGFALKFEGLDYGFVDRNTMTVNVPRMVQEIKDKSQKPALDNDPIIEFVNTSMRGGGDLFKICNGHDLRALLARALQRLIGTARQIDANADEMGRKLRLAYERDFLAMTALYDAVKAWERRNSPFICFSF
jgi:hypothetical protein